MEWNNDLCLKLIMEYKNMEVLWNPRNLSYYNKLIKEDAWAQLAETMNMNIEEIKKKMDSLKGSYRREKNRVKKSYRNANGTNSIYESKWFAYGSLQFLEEKYDPRRGLNALESPPSESEGESNINEIEEGITPQRLSPSEPSNETRNINFKSPNPKRRAIKRKMTEDSRMDGAFVSSENTTERRDRCSIFGDYIADKIRSFDNRLQAIAEHKIHNVLFKLEMSTYEHSVVPNSLDYDYALSLASLPQEVFQLSSEPFTAQDSSSNLGDNMSHFADLDSESD